MRITTLQRLFKFQRAKLGVALMVVTAVLFLIPPVSSAQNTPPIADAGEDQTIFVDQPTLLDGRGSFDPDGDPIVEWLWTVESQPTGSTFSIPDPRIPRPAFSGNLTGDYVISLVVSDGTDSSAPDTVTIHVVENLPPVAIATADVTSGPAPLTVEFDGSGSYDPEGGDLFYLWDFGDGSPTEPVISPTHVYLFPGRYTADITVEDDRGLQAIDTIVITVTEDTGQTPQEMIEELIGVVEGYVDIGSLSRWQGKRLIRLLDKAIRNLDKGRTGWAKCRMNRFIRIVKRYMRRGVLSTSEGLILIDAANDIIEAING